MQTADRYTSGQVADLLGVPVHRVRYVVDSRGIEGERVHSRLRLFNRDDVERIAAVLGHTPPEVGGYCHAPEL